MGADRLRRALGIVAFAALCLADPPARADGILEGLLNAIQNVAASSAWRNVDPAVQDCLASQYNLNAADLAAQGVLPDDPRLSNQMGNCQQMVAQGGAPEPDPAERMQQLTARYGAGAAQKIAAGNIDIGFTPDEVIEAWGNPDSRMRGAKGREIWVFGDDKVTFTRGRVSAVGH